MNSWKDTRVLIIGAARQGQALARYLSRQGAFVTLNDKTPEEKMESARQSLADTRVHWVFGGHPFTLLENVDLVCLSGGVPLDLPIVNEALLRGLPLSNDSQIFMQSISTPVIGITGSAGKTTTTTLVGRMAQAYVQSQPAAAGLRPLKAWVGGNIGQPLIDEVDQIQPNDLVILELSSFQLDQMTISPHIGAILNITPNHLDRHGTMEAYTAAKARIIAFQKKKDIAVLGRDDAGAWGIKDMARGHLVSFGLNQPPSDQVGTFYASGRLYVQDGARQVELMDEKLIQLRGEHNRLNVLAACAIAHAAGLPVESMVAGVTDFRGVQHRLEFVRTYNGAAWYNDSIATAPERTIAALRSFSEPLVLMLGGRDKKLPWENLAALIHSRVDHIVVFGEASPKILAAIGATPSGERPYTVDNCAGLKEAVQTAARIAQPGDVVLLSPGGTSFDEFHDFEERGEEYRKWVLQLS